MRFKKLTLQGKRQVDCTICLLYTYDAADE